jgi:antitoxin component YwqK of YwqJK toxin-antitoxin module
MIKVVMLILTVALFSCNNDLNKEKVLLYKDEYGRITQKVPYYIDKNMDTIVDGVVVHYFKNGQVSDSFILKDGNKNGVYYSFDSSGNLSSVFNYKSNKANGPAFYYFENGKTQNETLYKDDRLIYSKSFFRNGRVKEYFIFLNNSKASYYILYDSLGNKIEESGDSTELSVNK